MGYTCSRLQVSSLDFKQTFRASFHFTNPKRDGQNQTIPKENDGRVRSPGASLFARPSRHVCAVKPREMSSLERPSASRPRQSEA